MMQFKFSNRQILSAAIIVFYLIPLIFFSAFSMHLASHNKSWTFFSLGLLLIAFGTLSLIYLLFYWEQSLREKKRAETFILPQQTPIFFKEQKEEKVTTLSSTIAFGELPELEPDEFIENPQEATKEFNLLQTALIDSQRNFEALNAAIELKNQENKELEERAKKLQIKADQISQDFADYKLFSEEQLKQKQMQLIAMQQMVEDQRAEMEKKQGQIHLLDTKVHDLSYEIKTLLYLHEDEITPVFSSSKKEEHPQLLKKAETEVLRQTGMKMIDTPLMSIKQPGGAVTSQCDAALLLKKCINIAQKLTGANYYSSESSRYREFSSSYFSIDQRRLFDSLPSETGALLVIYSQKDQKLLFANNESKTLLGWSPEKFLEDFPVIMQEGMGEWKKSLHSLTTLPESQTRLIAKAKSGEEMLLNCHLGTIPSGLFRNYVIGVLYPS